MEGQVIVLTMGPILVFLGFFMFAVGTVIGSFLNVCIYRIPWEKSVIWPGSRCPRCWNPIAGLRQHPDRELAGPAGRMPEPAVRRSRPAMHWSSCWSGCSSRGSSWSTWFSASAGHMAMRSALPWRRCSTMHSWWHCWWPAAFIDRDLFIIPDSITVTGMVLGIALGTILPAIRPGAVGGHHPCRGILGRVIGLLVGGGLTEGVRRIASFVATLIASMLSGRYTYREAMGFGDVTLMAMIGAFLGWQGAVLTFFVGPFFGIVEACWKLFVKIKKLLARQKLSNLDRELPFGPYLSMGAIALVLSWRWFWPGFGKGLFETFHWVFWTLLGVNVGPLE